MTIGKRAKIAILGVVGATVVGGVIYILTKKQWPISGRSKIKATSLQSGAFDVTVNGTCTSSSVPIEFFDMSFYVNDTLGLGANWADEANKTQWTVGPPPAVGQELPYTFKWYPTAPGTYTLKARLYVRNTDDQQLDIFSDPIQVTVAAGPPEGIVSISATAT